MTLVQLRLLVVLLVLAAAEGIFEVRLVSVDPKKIELEWAPPSELDISLYLVEARLQGGQWGAVHAEQGNASSASVYELQQGFVYTIRVGALGKNVLAAPALYSNELSVAAGVPASPRLQNRGGCAPRSATHLWIFRPSTTDTTLKLLFDPPQAVAHMFLVQRHGMFGWSTVIEVPPGQMSNTSECPDTLVVELTGLQPARNYTLRVSAILSEETTHSDPVKVKTRGKKFATSLFGQPFFPPDGGLLAELTPNPSPFAKALSNAVGTGMVDLALLEYAKNRTEYNLVWLAKMYGFAWDWDAEMNVLHDGMRRFTSSFRIPLELGHRYLERRRLPEAQRWLELARKNIAGLPEVDEDYLASKFVSFAIAGLVGSVQMNIFYHLGHSYLFDGQFEKAAAVYAEGLPWTTQYAHFTLKSDDTFIAMSRWCNAALQLWGTPEAKEKANKLLANISDDSTKYHIMASDAVYYDTLMLYKGKATPQELLAKWGKQGVRSAAFITLGFGISQFLATNSTSEAVRTRRQLLSIVRAGDLSASFASTGADFDALRLDQVSGERGHAMII